MPKTRRQLDEAAKKETGAKPDSVYESALAPLKADGLISARKDGLVAHWFWRLSKLDVPEDGPVKPYPAPHLIHPSSVSK